MATSFFFYDLETSGLNPRSDRIMQFAGVRTDMELNIIGDPVNELVILNDDTIPSPEALMITGITPQKTLEEGFSEAEFAKRLTDQYFTPDTIIVGFNNVRFDDEFIRHLLWRNFHDPYEWSWKDGRSRWDILDLVRMTRALRPEGINWPVDEQGKATNRLELITQMNDISHTQAHDALNDVIATIEVAKLIKKTQPQLFDFLLELRDKNKLKKLVNLEDPQPFVYTSGRYDQKYQKTTVAFPLTVAPNKNVVVYDLRYQPEQFIALSQDQLAKRLFPTSEERLADDFVPVPVKVLQYNRCPAVAPVGVLEQGDGWQKIDLSASVVSSNLKILADNPDFAERIRTAYEDRPGLASQADPEARLYDSLIPDIDKMRIEAVRRADEQGLVDLHPDFRDERLGELLVHYKGRNYPRSLSQDEMIAWESWRTNHLNDQLPAVTKSLNHLASQQLSPDQQYILAEIQLWIESVLPADD